MKYALFASLDEINGIIIQKKNEYPLCNDVHINVAYIMMKSGTLIKPKAYNVMATKVIVTIVMTHIGCLLSVSIT